MSDQYAVIGNPISHSKSPLIHAQFARQTGEDLVYVALLAPRDGFARTLRAFMGSGGRGVNVTVPFKHEAFEQADRVGPHALQARAANVLTFDGSEIVADNTDGTGLLRDLTANLGIAIEGRRVLLMGAGGAAWGVVGPLLEHGPAELTVANRTPAKADGLVNAFRPVTRAGTALQASSFEALKGPYELVVNATSAGLQDEMPPLPTDIFAAGALAYDMVYGRRTPFLDFAAVRGVNAVDGLGMLVEQAAESFFIWRRVRPATAPVIALLRESTLKG